MADSDCVLSVTPAPGPPLALLRLKAIRVEFEVILPGFRSE